VLKLENGPRAARYNGPVLIHHDTVAVQLDESWKAARPLQPPVQEDIPILTGDGQVPMKKNDKRQASTI
jgi:hypothetical protein